jgi:hypothetical protein
MSTTEMLEALDIKLQQMGMMGQWYQRYDISTNAQECKQIVKDLKKELDPPCGMSHK